VSPPVSKKAHTCCYEQNWIVPAVLPLKQRQSQMLRGAGDASAILATLAISAPGHPQKDNASSNFLQTYTNTPNRGKWNNGKHLPFLIRRKRQRAGLLKLASCPIEECLQMNCAFTFVDSSHHIPRTLLQATFSLRQNVVYNRSYTRQYLRVAVCHATRSVH
jgi:hypothetical protein